jgi:hypothetical protein
MSHQRASELLNLLKQSEVVQQLLTRKRKSCRDPAGRGSITAYHVDLVSREKLPEEQHIAVLKKAAEEGLTAAQTRDVADAFKRVERGAIVVTELSC